jgi:hypothetical protein
VSQDGSGFALNASSREPNRADMGETTVSGSFHHDMT